MRKYGLIGKSLDHSFSKKYFDERFLRDGSGNTFELFPLNNVAELATLISSQPLLRGVAVTIPYKETVIPLLNRLHDTALLTGAVNCISIGKELTGYNTDVTGFEESLNPLLEPHHRGAIIFGTGGASKAVQYALNKLRIPFVLVSRNSAKGIAYSSVTPALVKDYPVLINCTPIGMYPDVNEAVKVPYDAVNSKNLLFDLVYNPAETVFLREGRLHGAKTENGLKMLEIQAEANLRIWENTP